MSDATLKAYVELGIIDKMMAPLRAIVRQFDGITKAGKAASKAFELSANLKQSADGLKAFADDVSSLIKKPLDTFTDFEAEMSKVRANTFNGVLTAQTRKEFADLSAAARQLGADTQFSGMEAAQGMTILATQGFAAKQQIEAMPGILDVAAASTESIATSADIATASMVQFGLKATDMGRIGDVLVKTANSSATGLVDIGEALKYVGSKAGEAGVSLETTTAMIGALGNAGVKGSMAGTALRAMLSGLQAPTKQGKSALALLGISTKDKAGNLKEIDVLLAEIERSMDKKFGVGKQGNKRAALLKAIVGEEAASSASILARAAGAGELQKLIAANRGAAGTAAAVAKDMSNNTAGAKKELDSALEELQLTIGEVLIPMLGDLVKGTREVVVEWTAWAKENPEVVKTVGLLVAGLAGFGLVAAPLLKGAAAIATVGEAIKKTALLAAAHPVLAIITAIALAALLIYENWADIGPFFERHWGKILAAVAVFMPALLPIIGAAKLVMDNWEPIKAFFVGLWDVVTTGFTTAMNWILEKINWVGTQIEAFKVSIMSDEELIAYQKAQAEAARATSALNTDNLDRYASSTSAGGVGDFGSGLEARSAADNAAAAVATMKSWWSSNMGPTDNTIKPNEDLAAAWAALQNENLQPAGPPMTVGSKDKAAGPQWDPVTGKAMGELKITVVDGSVAKTETRTDKGSWWTPKVATGRQ